MTDSSEIVSMSMTTVEEESEMSPTESRATVAAPQMEQPTDMSGVTMPPDGDEEEMDIDRAFTRFDSDSDSDVSEKKREQKGDDHAGSIVDFEEVLTDSYEAGLKELIVNPSKNQPLIEVMEKMWSMLGDYRKHIAERDERIKSKDAQIFKQTEQITSSLPMIQEDKTVDKIKKSEVIDLKRQLDAAHIREQDHQETIEFLRKQIDKLEDDINKRNRDEEDFDTDLAAVAKNKETMRKERQRMKGLLAEATEAAEKIKMEKEEYMNMYKNAYSQLESVRVQLSTKIGEVARLERLVETSDKDLSDAKTKLEQTAKNLQTIMSKVEGANSAMEAQKQKNQQLTVSLNELQTLSDNYREKETYLNEQVYLLKTKLFQAEDEVEMMGKQFKVHDTELSKLRTEVKKTKGIQETFSKRVVTTDVENVSINSKFKDLETEYKIRTREVGTKEKEILELNKKIQSMLQERAMLMKHILNATNLQKTNMKQIKTQTVALRSMELDGTAMREEIRVQKKTIENLNKQKNKLVLEKSILTKKISDTLEEARQFKMQMFNHKKDLAKKELELKRERNNLEALKAEKSLLYSKLEEQRHLFTDLKTKMKVVTHQIEQLKEDIHTKDELLTREEIGFKRLRTEKNSISSHLKTCREKIKLACTVIEQQEVEKVSMERRALMNKNEMQSQAKRLDQLSRNYCMLNTQLDRRTVELSLLYEKIALMNRILKQGEVQYNERLDDIRLLKLEVKKLRTEKAIVMKAFENMADLRHEIYHLNKDLAEERQKSQALQEEMETPINYHRWRLLEGSDPEKKDLIDKLRMTQKKLFKETEGKALQMEKYRNLELMYDNLKKYMETLPGPEVSQTLELTRRALREKINENKLFSAELSAYQSEIEEYKYTMERTKQELTDIKSKYYEMKSKRGSLKNESQTASLKTTLMSQSNMDKSVKNVVTLGSSDKKEAEQHAPNNKNQTV